nr:phage scaffolding protein [Paenibacillus shirakamiensis]
MGLTEEQANKAAAASQDELKGFIPKARFDEVNDTKKKLEKDLGERDGQLDELKKSAGASEDLKKQIETLQSENKTAADQYAADLKGLTLTNAIKSALNGKVHDEGLVAGLFDREKLVIDGDKIVGLDDQLKGLQESKAFLFKTDDTKAPGFKVGNDGKPTPVDPNKPISLQDAVTAHYQTK